MNLGDLPGGEQIVDQFRRCGEFARANGLRTTFHSDQFVVLNSPKPEVVEHSIAELAYQAEVAEWVEADVINVHAGGVYGDKPSALEQLRRGLDRLSDKVRQRLTLENDEKCYSPADLLTFCASVGIPLVYLVDVHHHRCNPDGVSVEEATNQAMATWDRDPDAWMTTAWRCPESCVVTTEQADRRFTATSGGEQRDMGLDVPFRERRRAWDAAESQVIRRQHRGNVVIKSLSRPLQKTKKDLRPFSTSPWHD